MNKILFLIATLGITSSLIGQEYVNTQKDFPSDLLSKTYVAGILIPDLLQPTVGLFDLQSVGKSSSELSEEILEHLRKTGLDIKKTGFINEHRVLRKRDRYALFAEIKDTPIDYYINVEVANPFSYISLIKIKNNDPYDIEEIYMIEWQGIKETFEKLDKKLKR